MVVSPVDGAGCAIESSDMAVWPADGGPETSDPMPNDAGASHNDGDWEVDGPPSEKG